MAGSNAPRPSDIRFFPTPTALAAWFEKHHLEAAELWLGFYKTGSGKPSVNWPQSVDEALRVGWIDGVRRSLGPESYVIRFTPRKPGSIWSRINLEKIAELKKKGLMRPAGEKIFAARDTTKTNRYSFEQEKKGFDVEIEKRIEKTSKKAWAWFSQRAPGYRRTSAFWVASAKGEETRERRFRVLVECSERGEPIPQLKPRKGAWETEAAAKKPAAKKTPAKVSAKKPDAKKAPTRTKKVKRSRRG